MIVKLYGLANVCGREKVNPIEKSTRHQFESTSIAAATVGTTHDILLSKTLVHVTENSG